MSVQNLAFCAYKTPSKLGTEKVTNGLFSGRKDILMLCVLPDSTAFSMIL
jgi:hypothetical protein